jgi:hypothetical protein
MIKPVQNPCLCPHCPQTSSASGNYNLKSWAAMFLLLSTTISIHSRKIAVARAGEKEGELQDMLEGG